MDWRPFRDDDLPGITALLERELAYDRPGEAYVRYLIVEDPSFDPALVWVADDGGRVIGIVAGCEPDERLQAPGGVKLFAVATEAQRRGVATRLFDAVEAALHARGVSECVALNCGNHRLSLGLDVRYTAALFLLLGRGYQLVGPTQDMLVPLAGSDAPDLDTAADEARLGERGVVFRRATPDEEQWVLLTSRGGARAGGIDAESPVGLPHPAGPPVAAAGDRNRRRRGPARLPGLRSVRRGAVGNARSDGRLPDGPRAWSRDRARGARRMNLSAVGREEPYARERYGRHILVHVSLEVPPRSPSLARLLCPP